MEKLLTRVQVSTAVSFWVRFIPVVLQKVTFMNVCINATFQGNKI